MRREKFLVGGRAGGAFIHLEVGVFSGKPADIKSRIGGDCIEDLEERFEAEASKHELQITVEIIGMEKPYYFNSVLGNG